MIPHLMEVVETLISKHLLITSIKTLCQYKRIKTKIMENERYENSCVQNL